MHNALIAGGLQVKTVYTAMTSQSAQNSDQKSLSEELRGALDWWREAGIDYDFADEVIDRLTEAKAERKAAPEVEVPKKRETVIATSAPSFAPQAGPEVSQIGGERSDWPQTLTAFNKWWLNEPSLDLGGGGPRIAPHGESSAKLMVLVSQPEESDRKSLLTGPRGKLLAGFLRAAEIAASECYFASILPRPMPLPDWAALKAAGLGAIALHQAALVDPQRIIAFGRNILPLLGHDQAQGPAQLTLSQGNKREISVLGAPGLEELLRSAPRRKRLWQDWLDWSG